jgi:hypothetical protein
MIDHIYMVYHGECKLQKLHVESDKKPNNLNEIKDNLLSMRTVVILGKGGIAGLEFINGDEQYKYNLVCSREFTVLVKINIKTLRDYCKRDLVKHLKPLYKDQMRIGEDFLEKYYDFKRGMKITFKSNHNSHLKQNIEEQKKIRDLHAERSLYNLRFRQLDADGKLMSFSHTKNEFSKMNILINNIDEMKSLEDPKGPKLALPEAFVRRVSRIPSRFPTLKPFVRNYRRNSTHMQSTNDPMYTVTDDKGIEPNKNVLLTLARYNKHIPSSTEYTDGSKIQKSTRANFSSLVSQEIDKLCTVGPSHSRNIVIF